MVSSTPICSISSFWISVMRSRRATIRSISVSATLAGASSLATSSSSQRICLNHKLVGLVDDDEQHLVVNRLSAGRRGQLLAAQQPVELQVVRVVERLGGGVSPTAEP